MSEGSLVRRRCDGSYTVDEWGLDTDLVQLVSPVFAVRWNVAVEGADALPEHGPAVLAFNRRFSLSEPFVVSRGVRHATGRFVRIAGVPDVAPLGPALRRLGGVLGRTDEVAGLLRADQLVAVALSASVRHRHHAGAPRLDLLAPALATGAPVYPVAVVGREVGRRWRLVIGPPVEPPTTRGPLAIDELGDRVRSGVQALLDTEFPPSLFRN